MRQKVEKAFDFHLKHSANKILQSCIISHISIHVNTQTQTKETKKIHLLQLKQACAQCRSTEWKNVILYSSEKEVELLQQSEMEICIWNI